MKANVKTIPYGNETTLYHTCHILQCQSQAVEEIAPLSLLILIVGMKPRMSWNYTHSQLNACL